MMPEQSVVVLGLPESGKTTFLAALWHIVTAMDIETKLSFDRLTAGDNVYLNDIARRWRDAVIQERTAFSGNQWVSMNLVDANDKKFRMTFPDVPGEAFQGMWEDRECEQEIAKGLKAVGVLLFIHSDTIVSPHWIVDEAQLSKAMDVEMEVEGGEVDWKPSLAPTQVQLVDILQMLQRGVLSVGPRRVAVMLSAWDKVVEDRTSPNAFLDKKLPFLAQYLHRPSNDWIFKVYGVSAQGGDYVGANGENARASADALRSLETASERIVLVDDGGSVGHDLTEPIAWLVT